MKFEFAKTKSGNFNVYNKQGDFLFVTNKTDTLFMEWLLEKHGTKNNDNVVYFELLLNNVKKDK